MRLDLQILENYNNQLLKQKEEKERPPMNESQLALFEQLMANNEAVSHAREQYQNQLLQRV